MGFDNPTDYLIAGEAPAPWKPTLAMTQVDDNGKLFISTD
jgi:hypothetical protein